MWEGEKSVSFIIYNNVCKSKNRILLMNVKEFWSMKVEK